MEITTKEILAFIISNKLLIIVFVAKILDCTFGTLKTIFLYKQKYFYSAIVFSIATYFYLTIFVLLARQDSELAKIVTCLATFIGTYFPAKGVGKIDERNKKERLYVYDITAPDLESGEEFAKIISDKNIPIKTYIANNKKWEEVLCCKIYCDKKEQSRMVNDLIPEGFKCNIQIPHKIIN